MNIRRIRTSLLALTLSVVLTVLPACRGEPTGSDGGTAKTSAIATTAPAPSVSEPQLESLKIDGIPLEEYTIVYAAQSTAIQTALERLGSFQHGQEYDQDKISAEYLNTMLQKRFGVTLPIQSDSEAPTAHEILIGDTKRDADNAFRSSDVDAYTVGMSDEALCFIGGAFGTTYHSIEYFEQYLLRQGGDVDLAKDFKITGTHHLIAIGCIGDSITQGIGSSNPLYTYPEALNRILWRDCIIYNFGCSAMTMRTDTGTWAYMNSTPYANARNAAPNIDIFTIMLGTNDSREDISVPRNEVKYTQGFTSLADALLAKNSDLKFILMNCPVYYGAGSSAAPYIRSFQNNIYAKYKDTYKLSFFDMHTYSKTNMPRSMFPDLIHPSDQGYVIMAEGVANMLKDELNLS